MFGHCCLSRLSSSTPSAPGIRWSVITTPIRGRFLVDDGVGVGDVGRGEDPEILLHHLSKVFQRLLFVVDVEHGVFAIVVSGIHAAILPGATSSVSLNADDVPPAVGLVLNAAAVTAGRSNVTVVHCPSSL